MDLFAKLASNMEEMTSTFETRMQQMETGIKKLSSTETAPHKDLASLSREFIDFRTLVWKSMAMMRGQLELLIQGLDRQETASRRKVLLFHGIAETAESSLSETISLVLADHFKLSDTNPDEIAACHRLGSNSSKPRPVLVRFANYKLRNLVWNSKSSLKSTGITVSEFLTKTRHDVFINARRHFGIRHCWTSEGRIVILPPDNKRRRIESMSELKPLLAEFPTAQPAPDKASSASQDKGKSSAMPTARTGRADSRSKRAVK